MRGVFITGTDTGVGKTFFGVLLTKLLIKHGIVVRPRKPIESGCLNFSPNDASLLQNAAGNQEALTTICPWQLALPISPERAGIIAGIHLTLTDLVRACQTDIKAGDFLLVEGAGGLLTPLAPKVLNADLAVALGLPLILVVADRLGCINHALLNLEAIRQRGLDLAAVILNRWGSNHAPDMDNAADLSKWLGVKIFCLDDCHHINLADLIIFS